MSFISIHPIDTDTDGTSEKFVLINLSHVDMIIIGNETSPTEIRFNGSIMAVRTRDIKSILDFRKSIVVNT